jgi:hypothetical protein
MDSDGQFGMFNDQLAEFSNLKHVRIVSSCSWLSEVAQVTKPSQIIAARLKNCSASYYSMHIRRNRKSERLRRSYERISRLESGNI